MSRMSDYDLQLQEIASLMAEPSPADLREMAMAHLSQQVQSMPVQDLLDILLTGLNEICARAVRSDDVLPHATRIGRIMAMSQLIASQLEARQEPEFKRFRVVS